jgi:hypothetical protein
MLAGRKNRNLKPQWGLLCPGQLHTAMGYTTIPTSINAHNALYNCMYAFMRLLGADMVSRSNVPTTDLRR